MSFEFRGGPARVIRLAGITTTGRDVVMEDPDRGHKSRTVWLNIRNAGDTNDLNVFFTEDAFDGGTDFRTIPPGEFLEGPIEASPPNTDKKVNQGTGTIWVAAAVATTDVEITAVFRA